MLPLCKIDASVIVTVGKRKLLKKYLLQNKKNKVCFWKMSWRGGTVFI